MMPEEYAYFDMAQSGNERGHRLAAISDTKIAYSFEPIPKNYLTPEQQKNIKGVQGELWSEYLDRPARIIEDQSYPRISSLSESGWSRKEDKNWDDFYGRLTSSHLQRLSKMGIAFRDFSHQLQFIKKELLPLPRLMKERLYVLKQKEMHLQKNLLYIQN